MSWEESLIQRYQACHPHGGLHTVLYFPPRNSLTPHTMPTVFMKQTQHSFVPSSRCSVGPGASAVGVLCDCSELCDVADTSSGAVGGNGVCAGGVGVLLEDKTFIQMQNNKNKVKLMNLRSQNLSVHHQRTSRTARNISPRH